MKWRRKDDEPISEGPPCPRCYSTMYAKSSQWFCPNPKCDFSEGGSLSNYPKYFGSIDDDVQKARLLAAARRRREKAEKKKKKRGKKRR
ncbi:MAG: hypothetical protein PVJ09_02960 [Candidatus Woesebacteria bacterium]|jgi:hypothetical protein